MSHLLVATTCAVVIFLLAAAAQAVTGFGLAMVAVPLLAVVVDPISAVVAATLVSTLLTFVAASREAVHVDRNTARTLSWTGLVGMPVGLLALTVLEPDQLILLVAAVLLALTGALSLKLRVPFTKPALWTAGVVSGALLTSTGMNGPPLVVALDGARMPPRRFRATLQFVFCLQDVFAVLAFVLIGKMSTLALTLAIGGLAGVPVGWWIGNRAFHAIPEQTFRQVVLAGLVCTALIAVVQTLV